ncbi:hypothetical protein A8B75_01745 [Sphingomonadales bacterium EhC05]|nr:hypothetical protein A8B75_01745 [Sphingomonadales bacterium EhC05]
MVKFRYFQKSDHIGHAIFAVICQPILGGDNPVMQASSFGDMSFDPFCHLRIASSPQSYAGQAPSVSNFNLAKASAICRRTSGHD